jgi:hypothetical protein
MCRPKIQSSLSTRLYPLVTKKEKKKIRKSKLGFSTDGSRETVRDDPALRILIRTKAGKGMMAN